MIKKTTSPDNLQTSRLSFQAVDLDGEHEEDAPLVAGIRDFSRLKGSRLECLAPSSLVRLVLKICVWGGMAHNQLGGAMGKPDSGQAWARYFTQRNQMRTATLRALVTESHRRGWFSRQKPTLPCPLDLDLKEPLPSWIDEAAREWDRYRAPKIDKLLNDRIAAIEACVALARNQEVITLASVRQVALVDLDLKRKSRRDTAAFSQRARRARDEFADWYWVKMDPARFEKDSTS